jgi:predicted RNA-binding protein with PIN domain
MNYIIDGYNLIGKLNSISLSDKQKEDKCISYLQNLPTKPKDRFLCVFDGKCKYSEYKSVHDYAFITVVFTDPEQTADSYIINYCAQKKDKSNIIGVSSDNEILYRLRKLRIKTFSCLEFVSYFNSFQTNNYENHESYLNDKDLDFWLNEFT